MPYFYYFCSEKTDRNGNFKWKFVRGFWLWKKHPNVVFNKL